MGTIVGMDKEILLAWPRLNSFVCVHPFSCVPHTIYSPTSSKLYKSEPLAQCLLKQLFKVSLEYWFYQFYLCKVFFSGSFSVIDSSYFLYVMALHSNLFFLCRTFCKRKVLWKQILSLNCWRANIKIFIKI